MIEVLQKSISNTFSIVLLTCIIVLFIVLFVSWIYLPFAVFSMKKELKKIRKLIEENKNRLD